MAFLFVVSRSYSLVIMTVSLRSCRRSSTCRRATYTVAYAPITWFTATWLHIFTPYAFYWPRVFLISSVFARIRAITLSFKSVNMSFVTRHRSFITCRISPSFTSTRRFAPLRIVSALLIYFYRFLMIFIILLAAPTSLVAMVVVVPPSTCPSSRPFSIIFESFRLRVVLFNLYWVVLTRELS